jgi:hypothetical protein
MSLIDLLKRCRDLTSVSHDSPWSHAGISEIVAALDRGIVAISAGKIPDGKELILLFAPTGALQETSMENGWAMEFLLLSETFDGLIE